MYEIKNIKKISEILWTNNLESPELLKSFLDRNMLFDTIITYGTWFFSLLLILTIFGTIFELIEIKFAGLLLSLFFIFGVLIWETKKSR